MLRSISRLFAGGRKAEPLGDRTNIDTQPSPTLSENPYSTTTSDPPNKRANQTREEWIRELEAEVTSLTVSISFQRKAREQHIKRQQKERAERLAAVEAQEELEFRMHYAERAARLQELSGGIERSVSWVTRMCERTKKDTNRLLKLSARYDARRAEWTREREALCKRQAAYARALDDATAAFDEAAKENATLMVELEELEAEEKDLDTIRELSAQD